MSIETTHDSNALAATLRVPSALVNRFAAIAALGLSLAWAMPANATTYLGTRFFPTTGTPDVFLELSITTDDTFGVLTAANILDWTLILRAPSLGYFDPLFGPLSGNNSSVQVTGSAFTASPTALSFNLGGDGLTVFVADDVSPVYCLQATSIFCTANPMQEILGTAFGYIVGTETGVLTIGEASIATPVPEPETWAMMLAGLTGLAAISRRRKPSGQGQLPRR